MPLSLRRAAVEPYLRGGSTVPVVPGESDATAEARRLLLNDDFLGDFLIGNYPTDRLHPDVLAEVERLLAEELGRDG